MFKIEKGIITYPVYKSDKAKIGAGLFCYKTVTFSAEKVVYNESDADYFDC